MKATDLLLLGLGGYLIYSTLSKSAVGASLGTFDSSGGQQTKAVSSPTAVPPLVIPTYTYPNPITQAVQALTQPTATQAAQNYTGTNVISALSAAGGSSAVQAFYSNPANFIDTGKVSIPKTSAVAAATSTSSSSVSSSTAARSSALAAQVVATNSTSALRSAGYTEQKINSTTSVWTPPRR